MAEERIKNEIEAPSAAEMMEFRSVMAGIKEANRLRFQEAGHTNGYVLQGCNPDELDAEDYRMYVSLEAGSLSVEKIHKARQAAAFSGRENKSAFLDWVSHRFMEIGFD